jgi:hypothetical protein
VDYRSGESGTEWEASDQDQSAEVGERPVHLSQAEEAFKKDGGLHEQISEGEDSFETERIPKTVMQQLIHQRYRPFAGMRGLGTANPISVSGITGITSTGVQIVGTTSNTCDITGLSRLAFYPFQESSPRNPNNFPHSHRRKYSIANKLIRLRPRETKQCGHLRPSKQEAIRLHDVLAFHKLHDLSPVSCLSRFCLKKQFPDYRLNIVLDKCSN